jgi:MFS family permease
MSGSFLKGRRAVWVFGAFALAYLMSYALRSINAVVAPSLIQEFGLSNAQLGSLTSAYFFGFALLQLPLGVWLDRYGARRIHTALILVAFTGAVLYATAQSSQQLWVGRALIGAGLSGALMAALKAYRFWFAAEKQQPLVAWMLVAGSSGALASTVPVEWMMRTIGWRGVFWACSVVLLVAAAAVFWLLPRDEEQASAARSQALGHPSYWSGYLEVFGSAYFWRFGLVSLLLHSGFIALQTLWAGPWLTQVVGLGNAATAQVLFWFNLVLMLGFLLLGTAVQTIERRRWPMEWLVLASSVGMVGSLVALILDTSPLAWLWWLCFAAASIPFTMVQTHVSTQFPLHLTGRAYTAYNLVLFVGIFVEQWLLGVAIDLFKALGKTQAQAFRSTLSAFVALQVVALVIFVVWSWHGRRALHHLNNRTAH